MVDDGSPDNVAGVVSKYGDTPSLKLVHQENLGVAAAYNKGLSIAQGRYIQILNADDWLHPEKFALQIEVFETDPSIGLVYSDYYMAFSYLVFKEELTVADRCLGPKQLDIFDSWWIQGVFPPCAALVRKEWLDHCGWFNINLKNFSDYELWLRLSTMGCLARYVPIRLAYYLQHPSSLTSGNREELKKDLIEARSIIAVEPR